MRTIINIVTAAALTVGLCGCAAGSSGAHLGGRLAVVAAENFWGSIAAQVAGERAEVVSLVSNPGTDPHDYEATPEDSRAVAEADYVIVNGAGYDRWASQLVDANPSSSRRVLTVAELAGRHEGDNPHMWYSPAIVRMVVDRVAADLSRLDAADSAVFAQQRQHFLGVALARYDALRARIRQRYAGVAVGATESIVVDLAGDLGLRLLTPPGYMTAIAEGDDPSSQDRSTADEQLVQRRVAVLMLNVQNQSSDVQRLVDHARAAGIPVVDVTETLYPASATFEDWQARQLADLAAALARATGR
jgi:zinc/manganese transport system substrate-binding protein